MRYRQYRVAKTREGEIVMQSRYVYTEDKMAYPWWKFWKWGVYDIDYKYDEWVTTTLPYVDEE